MDGLYMIFIFLKSFVLGCVMKVFGDQCKKALSDLEFYY